MLSAQIRVPQPGPLTAVGPNTELDFLLAASSLQISRAEGCTCPLLAFCRQLRVY